MPDTTTELESALKVQTDEHMAKTGLQKVSEPHCPEPKPAIKVAVQKCAPSTSELRNTLETAGRSSSNPASNEHDIRKSVTSKKTEQKCTSSNNELKSVVKAVRKSLLTSKFDAHEVEDPPAFEAAELKSTMGQSAEGKPENEVRFC